jgi:squalene-hopene/tetraprenyl-beta-curcumene cyclase
MSATEDGRYFPAAPVGLYFARLWYSEELYPLIFAAGALESARAARVGAVACP